jgi:hypothetical protein
MPFKDPEELKAYRRAYYAAHREEQIESAKAWQREHPTEARETNRRWYVKNGREYYAANSDRLRAHNAAWKARNPDRTRVHQKRAALKFRFGLTLAEYEAMHAAQGGLCAACQKPETHRGRNGEVTRLAVDHDHVTGFIRALLCHSCNTGIGSFYDDPTLLIAAADYIKRFRE